MAFCRNCGKELKSEMKFCENCGTSVETTVEKNVSAIKDSKELGRGLSDKRASKTNKKYGYAVVGLCTIIIVLIFLTFDLYDKSDYEEEIKQSFQEYVDTDSQYKDYGIKVLSVGLVKSTSNTYNGIVEVLYRGETYKVLITVTKDEDAFMWETKPNEFDFLLSN
jgi:hypothetical protein